MGAILGTGVFNPDGNTFPFSIAPCYRVLVWDFLLSFPIPIHHTSLMPSRHIATQFLTAQVAISTRERLGWIRPLALHYSIFLHL